jgi:cytoskeleton protein RodZ
MDESDLNPPSAGVAASGEALRQAREARGISLAEAGRMLKLSPRQLEAIEAEAFDKLPGRTWVRGFVRNYARFLELDPAPLLDRIEVPPQGDDFRLAPEPNAHGTMPEEPYGDQTHSSWPALGVAVLVVLAGFLAWYFGLPALLMRQASPLAKTAPAPAASAPSAASSEPAFPPHTAETAVVTAQAEPAPEASNPVAAAVASAPSPAAASEAAPALGVGEGALTFAFAQDAWVEVRDKSGRVIFSRLGKAGEQQEVRGDPPFALVVGNASHVTVTFNGADVDLSEHTKVDVARITLR